MSSGKKENGIAQVQGVLKYNEDTRSTMMARNFWKDKIYTDLGEGIGKYCEIRTVEINPRFSLDGIANAEYLSLMSINNYANHDRYLDKKYITPSIAHIYGSNPQISGNIGYWNVWGGNTVSYEPEHGRIPDALLADEVKIIHDYAQISDNNGLYYLDRVIENASLLENGEPRFDLRKGGYVQTVKTEDEKRVNFSNLHAYSSLPLFRKSSSGDRTIFEYDEKDTASQGNVSTVSYVNNENKDTTYISQTNVLEQNSILNRTRELFAQHKISTMIGRFHGDDTEPSEIDSAKSPRFGNSHGRNLLKLDASDDDKTNGYSNPYCRTWTYHHQYDRVSKMIRPFTDKEGNFASIEEIQKMNGNYRAKFSSKEKIDDGGVYLAKNTVLNKNGFVNITPSHNGNVDIKKCMFSIENLAWKDVPKNMNYLSKEQQGPNGGRIMWFPPYDLDFQESVNVSWDSNAFIGRGEKVYTYNNTDRSGTLSFTLLIDHPSVINDTRNATGMGEEKNVESDILRYFAGCEIPKWAPERIEEQEETEENREDISIVPPEDAEKIKFYVYFPNNYSGNYATITKSDWMNGVINDADWYLYLLAGYGAKYKDDSKEWRGYEIGIGSNSGLGVADEDEYYPNKPYEGEGCSHWIEREGEEATTEPKYQYKVDFDLRQILKNKENYIDKPSYGLNCKLDTSISEDANYSFAEFMSALLLYRNENKCEEIKNFLVSNGASEEKINGLLKLFSNKIEITKLDVKGSATGQDSVPKPECVLEEDKKFNKDFNGSNADLLAMRRAKIVGTMVKNAFGVEDEKYDDKGIIRNSNLLNPELDNEKEAKAQRYAVVEIYYNAAKSNKLSDITQTEPYVNQEDEPLTIEDNLNLEDNIDERLSDLIQKGREITVTIMDNNPQLRRYESEGEYFDKLDKESPLVYKNLVDKFKYFNPAFHSISPEGFNARLNFLQQCTRQGHTIEASDVNGFAQTAGNLAFGRMPVCVLRIGDFINTKIIIQSMSINYGANGMQWDLNPEGAGVQPMYAKVSLTITLLGGQSLNGPISRLQNAVSFNYYANTGVYDNRADRLLENDPSKYEYIWGPYPNNAKDN